MHDKNGGKGGELLQSLSYILLVKQSEQNKYLNLGLLNNY
jgi:hypothetical protein